MKLRHTLSLLALTAVALPFTALGQNDNDFQDWNGGDGGTWQVGGPADWINPDFGSLPQGASTFYESNDRNIDSRPLFSGTGGTVNVDDTNGDPTVGEMDFSGGPWTITGGTIDSVDSNNSATVVNVAAGSGNVTIDSTLNIAPNPTNNASIFYNGASGTTLTLNNINISSIPQSGTDGSGTQYNNQSAPFQFNGNTVSGQNLLLWAANGSTIVFNGNYTTDAGLTGGMVVGNYGDASMETGTYIFKGDLSENINGGKQFDFGSGIILLDTSETGTGPMVFVAAGQNLPQTLETMGAQTITNNILNQGASNATIGGSDASSSKFTGLIDTGGGELDLHAEAGGTVEFSNTISDTYSTMTKDGAGTIILSAANGNTFSTTSTTGFEMKAGTTLIKNSNGDALGNGTLAQLDAGAKFGGIGSTAHTLNVMGATSEISVGLSNQIGTLTLAGGLNAANGLTLDFKLAGTGYVGGEDNDLLTTNSFNVGGTVTINLSVFGNQPLLTDTPYQFIDGSDSEGPWAANPIFDIIAPAGYALDVDSSNPLFAGTGYDYDPSGFGLSVELVATPEPSTYALLGLGLLALVSISRWMRRGKMV